MSATTTSDYKPSVKNATTASSDGYFYPQHQVKITTSKIIIEISPEIRAQLDALPDVSPTEVKFTPEQDAIIREYYVKKNKADLCKIIGCGEKTLRKRYRELTLGS